MIVNVHINLRSPGRTQFSIRDRTLKLLWNDTYVRLSDVDFIVGRRHELVKATGEHNTHAYARGVLLEHDSTTTPDISNLVRITYNPFIDVSFIRTDTEGPVSYAAEVIGYQGKVYAQKEHII